MKFLFFLLVLLCTAGLSIADSPLQGTELNGVLSEEDKEMGLLEEVRAPAASADNRIRGRKMTMGNVMKPAEKKKVPCSNQAAAGKCNSEGKRTRGSNIVEQKQIVSRFSDQEMGDAGHVFTSDYHSPRHHPPKNN